MCTIQSTFKWRDCYQDWEYFLASGIEQSFTLKFLKKFQRSCTMTFDHCNYIVMWQLAQTRLFRWVIKYFVVGNRFQKEFENYCFEENKTQVSWAPELSFLLAYDVATVRLHVIRLVAFSYLHWDLWPVQIEFPLIKVLLLMFCPLSSKRKRKQLRQQFCPKLLIQPKILLCHLVHHLNCSFLGGGRLESVYKRKLVVPSLQIDALLYSPWRCFLVYVCFLMWRGTINARNFSQV